MTRRNDTDAVPFHVTCVKGGALIPGIHVLYQYRVAIATAHFMERDVSRTTKQPTLPPLLTPQLVAEYTVVPRAAATSRS